MSYYGRRRFGGGYRCSYGAFGYGGGYHSMALFREMEREDELRRQEEERRRAAELMRQAGDSERRKTEARYLGRFTPAGVWDADCEKWPAQQYTLGLAGGFTARMMRNTAHWSWCGYVKLPQWFPNRLKIYDFWNRKAPRAPVHKEFSYSKDGELGWDHTWGGDLCPLGKPTDGSEVGPNWGPHTRYTTLEMVKEECIAVAAWFASLALNGEVAVPAEVLEANRSHLQAIVDSHGRIKERKRAEKAATEAAVKAEADRKAAEEAEAQRLWDLAHPLEAALRDAKLRAEAAKKIAEAAAEAAAVAQRSVCSYEEELITKKGRKPRIIELIAYIEGLQQKDAAGEEITAAERRQMKRYEQLKRELAGRQGERWDREEAELEALRQAAAVAEAKKLETQAEVTALA
jgi:hypothetical protein